MAAPPRLPLGLPFDPGAAGAAGSRPRVSWREGRFRNWTVAVGEQRYRLHKFNLASGSSFFEAAMADNYNQDSPGHSSRESWT